MSEFKSYFKMIKHCDLTLSEELVYAIISRYSYRGVSKISRSFISDISGIKKHDTITKHTNRLEELGLITKEYVGKNKKSVIYKLNFKSEPFVIIMDSLMDVINGTELAFAIKLAGLRFGTTPWVKLSNNDIIKKLNIGKSTFYDNINKLIDKKIIIKIKDCYVFNPNYFPVFQKISNDTMDLIKCALDQDPSSPAYKAISNAMENSFIGISNPHKYVYKCLTGEAFVKDSNNNIEICNIKGFNF